MLQASKIYAKRFALTHMFHTDFSSASYQPKTVSFDFFCVNVRVCVFEFSWAIAYFETDTVSRHHPLFSPFALNCIQIICRLVVVIYRKSQFTSTTVHAAHTHMIEFIKCAWNDAAFMGIGVEFLRNLNVKIENRTLHSWADSFKREKKKWRKHITSSQQIKWGCRLIWTLISR